MAQDEATSTNSRPLSGSQAATRPADPSVWPYKRRFAAVMAQVRRPVPFRTRKLRPGTAMVLHSTGCGRVARRRITRTGSPSEHTPQGASRISGHQQDTPGTHTATGPPHTRETTTDLCCDAWIESATLNVLMPFSRWSCQGKQYGNCIATGRLIGARLASI